MPVQERTDRDLTGVFSLLLTLGTTFLIGTLVIRSGDTQIPTGGVGDTPPIGNAEDLSEQLELNGPILIPDVAGADRDIYVNQVDDETGSRWVAFDARAASSDRACTIEWQPDTEIFRDPCTGETFPADGDGLRQYNVTVQGSELRLGP